MGNPGEAAQGDLLHSREQLIEEALALKARRFACAG